MRDLRARAIVDVATREQHSRLKDDVSRNSRPDFWKCQHINFVLTADFSSNLLSGFVDFVVEKQTQSENLVRLISDHMFSIGYGVLRLLFQVLDTRDLVVERASLVEGQHELSLPFILGQTGDFRGAKLEVIISRDAGTG